MKNYISIIMAAFFLMTIAAHATNDNKGLLITHKDGSYTFLLLNREIEMTWTNDQTLHISNKQNINYDMSIFDMEEFVIAMQPTGVFSTVTESGVMLRSQVQREDEKTMLIGSNTEMTSDSFIIPQTLLGYNVVGLMDKAFAQNKGLSSLTIPSYVTSIGKGVFIGCDGLKELMVDKENSVYDNRDNCQAIIETTNNTLVAGFSKSVIPPSVTAIGASAFEGCNGLTFVEIPKDVISIGSDAFKDCKELTDVYCYAKKIPSTDPTAFNNTGKVTLHVPVSLMEEYRMVKPWKYFGQIVALPHIIYMVNGEIYKNVEFDYGETITAENEPIKEGYTFSGWSEIPAIMPSHDVIVTGWFVKDHYTFEEDGAGYEMNEDKTVTFTKQENGSGTCEIPASVVIDGQKYQVTSIAEGAFKDNTNLKELSIPESIVSIGDDAFAGCTNLEKINLYSDKPISIDQAAASSVFSGVDTENSILYVPAGTADAYRQAEGWKAFKNIVEMEDPDDINADDGSYEIYTLGGIHVEKLQKGVNIIKYKNGSTQKVFTK